MVHNLWHVKYHRKSLNIETSRRICAETSVKWIIRLETSEELVTIFSGIHFRELSQSKTRGRWEQNGSSLPLSVGFGKKLFKIKLSAYLIKYENEFRFVWGGDAASMRLGSHPDMKQAKLTGSQHFDRFYGDLYGECRNMTGLVGWEPRTPSAVADATGATLTSRQRDSNSGGDFSRNKGSYN